MASPNSDPAAAAAAAEPIPWDVLLQADLSDAPDPNNPDNDPVPTYTSTDASPFLHLLSSQPTLAADLQLPLTSYPASIPTVRFNASDTSDPSPSPSDPKPGPAAVAAAQRRIIDSFFRVITSSRDPALAALFVRHGLVSPDVPDATGRTPLVAAVEAGDTAMVRTLLGLGAGVDVFAYATTMTTTTTTTTGSTDSKATTAAPGERTALMVAASQGRLALVKLLREEFGADDGLVAPRDGQIALRLAAEAGHREVVAYLPARRAGAWRRWAAHHAAAVARARRAAARLARLARLLVWELPRFLLWDVPRHAIVRPAWRRARWCWTNRGRFPGWCRRQVAEMPGRAERAGKAVWRGAKKVPKGVWGVVKKVPRAVETLLKWVWKVVRRIPGVVVYVCAWVWRSLQRLGTAVGRVFLRVVAALHTAVAAVLDLFRTITLQDVWNGVRDVLDAVFRQLPLAILKIVGSTGLLAIGVIIGLFGLAGKLVVFLFQLLWYVVKYVPEQLWEILSGIWASIAKGYHEIMVWINPKY